jgi:hypothetical protein
LLLRVKSKFLGFDLSEFFQVRYEEARFNKIWVHDGHLDDKSVQVLTQFHLLEANKISLYVSLEVCNGVKKGKHGLLLNLVELVVDFCNKLLLDTLSRSWAF